MYNSICKEQGQLRIEKGNWTVGISSAIQTYHFADANALFNVAKSFVEIVRPSGKIENGKNYTLRKATNDFQNLVISQLK